MEINQKSILYKFSPFHYKYYNIDWIQVDKAYIRTYKPLGEYGGWGIRYAFKNGKAYNVSGNIGLQLILKNGKKILFGTQKPEELKEIIDQLTEQGIINKRE